MLKRLRKNRQGIKSIVLATTKKLITQGTLRIWGVTPATIQQLVSRVIPKSVRRRFITNIYPIKLPGIEFLPGQDLILLDLPARLVAMPPNGLSYVHNILKKTGIRFQTVDLDIILYHRYHSQRILDGLDRVISTNGYIMKEDPWEAMGIEEEWSKPEVVEYFRPEINEIIKGLIEAQPKIIGISLHGTNLMITRQVVNGIRARFPEVIVLAGGYDCVDPIVGPHKFPEYDYMVIGEAELTLPPLVKTLVAGEKPRDLPGIISRYDSPDRTWMPGPLLQGLDSIDFPRYDWADLKLYRRYDGRQFTPILTSRGCRWSRCRFCSECFLWRQRSPKNVVDELEWLVEQGSRTFQFNDSDMNNAPDTLLKICDEIIRRKLRITLTGQIRISKHGTREFFDRLRAAGATRLRFGVDGWTNHTLQLERKGYTTSMVDQNLQNCYKAGIYISVNLVVGIPGETDEDIKETIANMLRNKRYIGIVESIRTLILGARCEYHRNPERYGICFRGEKESLYTKYPVAIPDDLWYSTDPYIDHEIRLCRWDTVSTALRAGGMNLGPYVKWRAEKEGG